MWKRLCLMILAVLMLAGCGGSPAAEPQEKTNKEIYSLYLDLKSENNLLFSTYDVEVIMDDKELGTIANGKTFSQVIQLEEGSHTLKISKAGDSSVNARKNIDLNRDMSFRCDISHGSSIELKNIETKDGIEDNAISVPEVTGMVLADAETRLKELGFDNITSVGLSGSIWMESNWLVTEQSIPADTQIDRHDEISLTCIHLDEYFNELLTGKTVDEIVKMSQEDWYSVTFEDDSYNDMDSDVESMDEETRKKWVAVSARQYAGADKTAKVYIEDSTKEPAQEESAKESESETAANDSGVSKEFKAALKSAESYAKYMNMSKAAIYDQLISEYGDKFPKDAAQYAVDNVKADWKENALKSAESYAKYMHMSKAAIYDQLISEYGDQFTKSEAKYAVDNVQADWNANALESAKSYRELMNMSKSAIYDQLISEYGDQFTKSEAQYAIDHLD